jgi:thioesterase-3
MAHPYFDITVRGFHIDVFGHVNNARYLEFLEDARWCIYADMLTELQRRQLALAIVNININYRKEALLHQVLRITAEVTRLGNTSFTISQQVLAVDEPTIVFADATLVCVILDSNGQPYSLDETSRRRFFPTCFPT